jgi:quercetin dioxygenase-like cupin family protein
MKYVGTLLSLYLLVSNGAFAGWTWAAEADKPPTQTIYRSGSLGAFDGPAEVFTGKTHIELLFPTNGTANFSGAYVTFEPGARSFWHTHPAGQHILVISGVGRTGVWGGPVEEIKAGDLIWCPPKVKHWHGASPTSAMTHLVITGMLDGKNVEWLEEVSDEQYNGKTQQGDKP